MTPIYQHIIGQLVRDTPTEPGMEAPALGFYAFLLIVVVVCGSLGYLLRNMWKALAENAATHAGKYFVAYAKGSALILIAVFSSFAETWGMLTASDVRYFQWWDYVIALTKPLAAGLAVLVAFLDRSAANINTPPDKPNG
jgi:hypothetical protein